MDGHSWVIQTKPEGLPMKAPMMENSVLLRRER